MINEAELNCRAAINSFRLPAMSPVPEFILPASFDFSFGSNSTASGRYPVAGGGYPADAARKIKSSLRGSGDASGRKSISFGPTTTFTSTDQLDDPAPIMHTKLVAPFNFLLPHYFRFLSGSCGFC